MQKLTSVIAGALLVVGAVAAQGQTVIPMATGRGGSAHQRSTWQVSGATISIEYGRPKLKGRSEAEMMPAGKPWRTGADVATILTTDRTLTFGGVTLAPGRYTINTQPGPSAWQIIFGRLKTPEQWGVPYQPDLEIGRATAAVSRAKAPDEELTFYIDRSAPAPALRLQWGTTSVTAPFTVGK